MNLWRDVRGNTAMIFALCLLPILALAGGAIDMTRQRTASVEAQSALDAALLYVAHESGELSDTQLKETAERLFLEEMKGRNLVIEKFQLNRDGDNLTANVDAHIPTTLLGLIGIGELNVARTSEVRYSERTFEIALSLDTTGSMEGDKLKRLQSASKLLVDKIDAGTSKTQNRKFAVVPFTTWVNVGPTKWKKNWIDKNGKSDVSATNLLPNVSRTALYDVLGEAWPGCVEARTYPYDVDDTRPSRSDAETLFTPSFYPDEPDDRRSYGNDYLYDGTGSGGVLGRIGNVVKYGLNPITGQLNNRRISKKSNYRFFSDVDTPIGPGFNCATRPITPLTENLALVRSEIDALKAEGSTNITEGVAWGWRVLSPSIPFGQGAPYSDKSVDKILILLTDGNNHISKRYDGRGSDYSAYGYLANGRLGLSTGASQQDIWQEMDKRTLEACTNAKRDGLIVYTIRLELADDRSDKLLKACATGPEYYLDVPDARQLDAAFSSIADDILQLYLAR
ncbi:TadE/TadG family type IV pilus assembly protein [Henriciella litoralis]|uniref:TadE/TadG family type IV pilus assembly protein n=1 Tax=Henriciella litoralis TaxID=568102 RepID=UPI00146F3338|nr:TadE/TadG family type IV pilus assembly protein [Henriciella litoralis]